MKYLKNRELEDKKITAALKQAAENYENGELAEVETTLTEIVNAIREFSTLSK